MYMLEGHVLLLLAKETSIAFVSLHVCVLYALFPVIF